MKDVQIEQDARRLRVRPKTLRDALSRGTTSYALAERMSALYGRPMDDFRRRPPRKRATA